jgi:hypothetical protein
MSPLWKLRRTLTAGRGRWPVKLLFMCSNLFDGEMLLMTWR